MLKQLKLKHKKSHKKAIIISSIIVILLAGGSAFAFREQLGLTSRDDATFEEATPEERQDEDTAEQQNSDPAWKTNDTDETDDSNKQDTSSDEPKNTGGTAKSAADRVIISSVNQDGNTMAIRTIIQPLVSGGTCTLKMGKVSQKTIHKTADVQGMPSYSTCKGFNIDVSGMAKGSWNVEVTYTNNNGNSKTGRGTAVVK